MHTSSRQAPCLTLVMTIVILVGTTWMTWPYVQTWAGATVRFAESGDALVLTDEPSKGLPTMRIPLYRQGTVRYFSAGVGIEERNADYPPFALKLMFTAGGRPYVAGVAVRIENVKDGQTLEVPREHVNGPWLFVDLPPGTYRIRATLGEQSEALTGIRLESGMTNTVHLRWADVPGEPEGSAKE